MWLVFSLSLTLDFKSEFIWMHTSWDEYVSKIYWLKISTQK